MWSVTLTEWQGVRVFENRVLRRICEPKRNEISGWRKLYNEELHNLYSSPTTIGITKSKRMKWPK
jgi:hypothetical protein